MSEPTLDYKQHGWGGNNEEYFVWISDATLRKHLNVYLKEQGICILSYLELQEKVKHIQEQQHQALQQLLRLDYWLTCDDPDVVIQPLTMAAYKRLRGEK